MLRRVAVFGGSFDPFHLGHRAVAEQARLSLLAEDIWIIPAGSPPLHEPPQAAADDRLEMCRVAAATMDCALVLDIEVRRPGPSYTVTTMIELTAGAPDHEFWIVLGADAARSIRLWEGASELLANHHFCIVNRDGTGRVKWSEAIELGFGPDRCRLVSIASPSISGTETRCRVARGADVSDLVGPEVADVIRRRGLYRPLPGGVP